MIDKKWALTIRRVNLHVRVDARQIKPPNAVVIAGVRCLELINFDRRELRIHRRNYSIYVAVHTAILRAHEKAPPVRT